MGREAGTVENRYGLDFEALAQGAQESERVMRLIRMQAKAIEVLGSKEKAKRWLGAPNRALGGVPPISLLDTDQGTLAAEEVLGRIECGVFS